MFYEANESSSACHPGQDHLVETGTPPHELTAVEIAEAGRSVKCPLAAWRVASEGGPDFDRGRAGSGLPGPACRRDGGFAQISRLPGRSPREYSRGAFPRDKDGCRRSAGVGALRLPVLAGTGPGQRLLGHRDRRGGARVPWG